MATRKNGKTYDDYYNQQTEINKAAAEKQVADITASTQKSINNYNTTVDTATENTVGQYQQRIDEAPKVYQEQYDLNAIAELVNKRQLEESMANMGLTDSGTNRSQQTALSVMRGNADAATRRQEQDYVNQLTTAIDDVRAESEANKANYANQMNTALDENVAAIWNNAQALSAEQATSLYNQQEQNSTNEYVAQLEADAAAIKAKQDATQQQFENILKYAETYGTDFATAHTELYGEPEGSGTASSEKIAREAALSGVSNWNAASGGIFNKTFWIVNNPEAEGKNVYEDIVQEQLKKSAGWLNLTDAQQSAAIAVAIGKSVGTTWPSQSEENKTKNDERIKSALKAAGFVEKHSDPDDPKDDTEWENVYSKAVETYKKTY